MANFHFHVHFMPIIPLIIYGILVEIKQRIISIQQLMVIMNTSTIGISKISKLQQGKTKISSKPRKALKNYNQLNL